MGQSSECGQVTESPHSPHHLDAQEQGHIKTSRDVYESLPAQGGSEEERQVKKCPE